MGGDGLEEVGADTDRPEGIPPPVPLGDPPLPAPVREPGTSSGGPRGSHESRKRAPQDARIAPPALLSPPRAGGVGVGPEPTA
eukprot:9275834-Alexandrium_andersonii.AAC.1